VLPGLSRAILRISPPPDRGFRKKQFVFPRLETRQLLSPPSPRVTALRSFFLCFKRLPVLVPLSPLQREEWRRSALRVLSPIPFLSFGLRPFPPPSPSHVRFSFSPLFSEISEAIQGRMIFFGTPPTCVFHLPGEDSIF